MNTALINKLLEKAKAEREEENFDRAFEFSKKALVFGQKQELFEEVNEILIEIGLTLKEQSISKNEVQYLDKAVRYFEEVFEKKYLSTKEEVTLLFEIGNSYLDFKKKNLAEKYLEQALNHAQNLPTENIQILLKLAELATINREAEKVIHFLLEAEKVIQSYDIEADLKIQVFQKIADYYVSQASYTPIPKYAQKVLSLAKAQNNGEYKAKALNTAAIPHAVRGEYKEAFEYMKMALETAESLQLNKIIASTLVNIGNIFSALYSYEEAIKSYNRVLDNYKEELHPVSVGITYFNLASSYKGFDDLDNSEVYFRKALEIGKKHQHKLLISRVYFELVQIYIRRDDLETAIAYSFEAEKVYPKEGNRPSLETYLSNQCELSFLRQEYKKALEYGEEAILNCTKQNNLKTLKRTYKAMANTYKALGDFEQAFHYLELFNETSEEFMLQMRQRRTIDLEIQYALKDKESEIEKLQQELELDKVKIQFQGELETQNKKLKMSNEALRQFTYAISHDLKEPLRMISSFSNLWYRRHRKEADEIDKEYFGYIRNGAVRMTNMLQGLLDFATIGENAKPTETVDVNQMIADIRTVLYVKIQENEAVFDVGQLPIVNTHKILLFQLLQNLVSNAIKFKKPEVFPIIKIQCKTEEERYIISITDNGIGIPEKHLETIFKIFKRLHTKEEYEGTGIGLSLCQKIIHHLGGELWLTSKVGEGSTFSFSLPR
ncbi:MAG: ATP-binding protein [Saprospiraceae bacterium]